MHLSALLRLVHPKDEHVTTFRQELRSRFATLGLLIIVVLGALFIRLWTVQVIAGERYARMADDNRIREVEIEAPRGRILDRRGRALVTNRPALAVTAQAVVAEDAGMLSRLSTLLDMPVDEIEERLCSSKQAPLEPRVVRLDVPMEIVSYLAEHSPDFPGVRVETIAVREYPFGNLAAHVLGYTGEISEGQLGERDLSGYRLGDVVGKAGAERRFETVLQGRKGHERVEVNASGKVQRHVGRREPIAGRDVVLTLDADIQRVAEEALADAIREAHAQKFRKARAGAIVALDVGTGDVLAMASAPTYDPKLFVGGIGSRDWKRLNEKSSEYPLNNRALMAAYPPASTFKAVTGLAGLEYGVAREWSTYRCGGRWTEMGTEWAKWCWSRGGHGGVTFRRGIEDSCDTVFYKIGYELYKRKKEELQAVARKMGFGRRTGIDLPGEVAGRVPDAAWKKRFNRFFPEYSMWLPGDTVNMAIGQGDMLVTPLQLARGYASIGNGGLMVRPHVLKEVLGEDGEVALRYERQEPGPNGVRAVNLAVMRRALAGVVERGTGRGAFAGFAESVAGKTGTAQVKGKDDYAWFVAFAPVEQPKYAVAVVVEQGGHGGSVAAPAARQVLAKLLGQPVTEIHTTDVSR